MANLGRETTNNNGVQDAQLRAVKPAVDTTVLKSDLAAGKEKALADDIIAKLSEKLNLSQEALGEYLQKLTSKSIDATLARVVDVVKRQGNAEFSESQIEGIRELLAEAAAAKEQPQAPKALTLAQLQQFFAARDKEKQESEQKAAESEAEKPIAPEAAAPSPEPEEQSKEEQSKEEPEAAPAPAIDVAKVQAYVQMQFDKLFETENQIIESTAAALQLAQAAAESPIQKIDTQMSGIGNSIGQMSQRLEQLELFELPAIDIPAPVVSIPEVNVLPPPVNVNQDVVPEASEDLELQAALQDSTAMIMSQIDTQVNQLGSMLVDSNSMLQQVLLSPIQSIGLAIGTISTAISVALVAPFKTLSSKISSVVGTVGNLVIAPFKLIENKISGIVNIVTGFVGGMFKSAIGTISGAMSSVTKFITSPFKAISEKLLGVGKALKDGFKDVMAGVGSAIASVALAPLKAIGGLFSKLNPFKKKKKKKDTMKMKLAQMIDKVNDFIDNFFDRMLGHVDAFLDRVLKSAKKIITKLMIHIFTWLLVNVALIGAVLALVLPLIADPLMKILQPIMDFIDKTITKVLGFLAPIRDFLLNNLTKIIDNIIVPLGKFILEVLKGVWDSVLAPFLRGIGTVAEALGQALGKLIIGIADFFVDTLLPFLRDSLLPVLDTILGGIKALIDAIVPWITPLVDTIFSILQEFLEAIKPWIKPLVDVVLATLVSLIDGIKTIVNTLVELVKAIAPVVVELGKFLATVFMDILNSVKFVYDTVVKPIAKAIGEFIKIVMNIGSWLWGKIKSAIGLGEDSVIGKTASFLGNAWNAVTGGTKSKLTDINEANKMIDQLNEQIAQLSDQSQIGKMQKELAEAGKRMLEVKAEDVLDLTNAITDVISLIKDKVIAGIDKLIELAESAPEIQISEEVEAKEVNIPQVDSANVQALQSASSTETADQVEAVSQEATANAAITATADKKKDKALMQFLSKMSAAMDNNFNAILEKLDNKPDLMPMPILTSTNANNLASMENLF